MTLTVRLDETLQVALERYCTATGSSKSLVVQESLAVYLLGDAQAAAAKAAPATGNTAAPSPLFRAFAEAGLMGCCELGGPSAVKAVVRAKAMQRIRRHSP